MTTATRLLTSLVLLATCLAGLGSARPEWLAGLGQSWRQLADGQRSCALGRDQAEALREREKVVFARVEAKTRVVEQLAAGELTLFEAAAWFKHWNNDPPEYAVVYQGAFPGDCPGEKVCRQVIRWAEVHLQATMPPSQAQEVICRLEADLDAHIADHGRVILPGE